MGLLASHSHPSLRHPPLPHGGAGDGPGGGGGDAAGSEDAGGSAPPEPQAAGEQGLPTGSGLCGLGQWVPLPSAQGEMGAAVCGGHLSRQRKGRRRFRIGHFFEAMNSEFSLGRFGQRTPLGVHRFLVLCFLAYLLAHWVRMEQEGEGLTWREAARESLRLLLPGLVAQAALGELHAPGLWHPPPDEVRGKAGLCRLCRRCKF